ncbi:MAG: potassium transporter [Solibacillus sp.]
MKKLNRSSILLIIIVILLLLFALYYYVILPKKQEEERLQQSVNQVQSEVTALQENIRILVEEQEYVEENTYAMRKKLPPNRMMQQLLLDIEEIEYVSESKVLAVNFNNYDAVVNASTLQDPNVQEVPAEADVAADGTAEENTDNVESQERTDVTEEVPVSTVTRETLQAELKMVTFNMNVEAPDRKNIEAFVKELENLERVMRIDSISYNLLGESDLLEEQLYDLTTAVVQVTTFFYEGE